MYCEGLENDWYGRGKVIRIGSDCNESLVWEAECSDRDKDDTRTSLAPEAEAVAEWNEMNRPRPGNVCLKDDGSLYFVLDDEKRLMECVIEYEDGEWILRANDSIIARF